MTSRVRRILFQVGIFALAGVLLYLALGGLGRHGLLHGVSNHVLLQEATAGAAGLDVFGFESALG